jgi:hypothetical protein
MVSSANFSQMKVGFDMKKFLLASVAALFMATGMVTSPSLRCSWQQGQHTRGHGEMSCVTR